MNESYESTLSHFYVKGFLFIYLFRSFLKLLFESPNFYKKKSRENPLWQSQYKNKFSQYKNKLASLIKIHSIYNHVLNILRLFDD